MTDLQTSTRAPLMQRNFRHYQDGVVVGHMLR